MKKPGFPGLSSLPVRASRVVLDTSAYSRFRANHDDVVDCIARAEMVYLPVTVLGELEAAFLCGTRTKENQVALRDFLEEPFVSVLPITVDVARVYGEVFSTLRRTGTPIPINDIWIAATCIDAGAHLITFDEDFARIARLEQTLFAC